MKQTNLDKFKDWIVEHRKEIIISGAIIFAYRCGFRNGCKATDRAVTKVFKNLDAFITKTLKITKF